MLSRRKPIRVCTLNSRTKKWWVIWQVLGSRAAEHFHAQLPLFALDTDGTPSKGKFIMGRRNWCSVRWDQMTGGLSFDIRVEREQGIGETVGYARPLSSSGLYLAI
jgi:hypothetical protein